VYGQAGLDAFISRLKNKTMAEYGFSEVNFGKTHYFKKNEKGALRSACGKYQWIDPKLGLNTILFDEMPPDEFMCAACRRKAIKELYTSMFV